MYWVYLKHSQQWLPEGIEVALKFTWNTVSSDCQKVSKLFWSLPETQSAVTARRYRSCSEVYLKHSQQWLPEGIEVALKFTWNTVSSDCQKVSKLFWSLPETHSTGRHIPMFQVPVDQCIEFTWNTVSSDCQKVSKLLWSLPETQSAVTARRYRSCSEVYLKHSQQWLPEGIEVVLKFTWNTVSSDCQKVSKLFWSLPETQSAVTARRYRSCSEVYLKHSQQWLPEGIEVVLKFTWNTVSSDCQKVSKLLRGVSSSKLNLPPNSCIPSKAKMTMNRKSSSNKLAMERILFSKDATRLRRDDQYL